MPEITINLNRELILQKIQQKYGLNASPWECNDYFAHCCDCCGTPYTCCSKGDCCFSSDSVIYGRFHGLRGAGSCWIDMFSAGWEAWGIFCRPAPGAPCEFPFTKVKNECGKWEYDTRKLFPPETCGCCKYPTDMFSHRYTVTVTVDGIKSDPLILRDEYNNGSVGFTNIGGWPPINAIGWHSSSAGGYPITFDGGTSPGPALHSATHVCPKNQEYEVTTVADVSASLHNKKFTVNGVDVGYNVTGESSPTMFTITVSIASNATAEEVAAATVQAINASNASSGSTAISLATFGIGAGEILMTSCGTTGNAVDGGTGFTFVTTEGGTNSEWVLIFDGLNHGIECLTGTETDPITITLTSKNCGEATSTFNCDSIEWYYDGEEYTSRTVSHTITVTITNNWSIAQSSYDVYGGSGWGNLPSECDVYLATFYATCEWTETDGWLFTLTTESVDVETGVVTKNIITTTEGYWDESVEPAELDDTFRKADCCGLACLGYEINLNGPVGALEYWPCDGQWGSIWHTFKRVTVPATDEVTITGAVGFKIYASPCCKQDSGCFKENGLCNGECCQECAAPAELDISMEWNIEAGTAKINAMWSDEDCEGMACYKLYLFRSTQQPEPDPFVVNRTLHSSGPPSESCLDGNYQVSMGCQPAGGSETCRYIDELLGSHFSGPWWCWECVATTKNMDVEVEIDIGDTNREHWYFAVVACNSYDPDACTACSDTASCCSGLSNIVHEEIGVCPPPPNITNLRGLYGKTTESEVLFVGPWITTEYIYLNWTKPAQRPAIYRVYQADSGASLYPSAMTCPLNVAFHCIAIVSGKDDRYDAIIGGPWSSPTPPPAVRPPDPRPPKAFFYRIKTCNIKQTSCTDNLTDCCETGFSNCVKVMRGVTDDKIVKHQPAYDGMGAGGMEAGSGYHVYLQGAIGFYHPGISLRAGKNTDDDSSDKKSLTPYWVNGYPDTNGTYYTCWDWTTTAFYAVYIPPKSEEDEPEWKIIPNTLNETYFYPSWDWGIQRRFECTRKSGVLSLEVFHEFSTLNRHAEFPIDMIVSYNAKNAFVPHNLALHGTAEVSLTVTSLVLLGSAGVMFNNGGLLLRDTAKFRIRSSRKVSTNIGNLHKDDPYIILRTKAKNQYGEPLYLTLRDMLYKGLILLEDENPLDLTPPHDTPHPTVITTYDDTLTTPLGKVSPFFSNYDPVLGNGDFIVKGKAILSWEYGSPYGYDIFFQLWTGMFP